MELDYQTVKALSAPTRIKILHQLLEREGTPTNLSEDLEKSKSTISSHLAVLTDAGLVEKDAEEGRRRVVYRPTDKARAIVEGRKRTVTFSVTSSVLTAAAGIGVLGSRVADRFVSFHSTETSADGAGTRMESLDAPVESSGGDAGTAEAVDSIHSVLPADADILLLGGVLLLIGVVAGYYSLLLWRMRSVEEDS